jgi:hypothetical protein
MSKFQKTEIASLTGPSNLWLEIYHRQLSLQNSVSALNSYGYETLWSLHFDVITSLASVCWWKKKGWGTVPQYAKA